MKRYFRFLSRTMLAGLAAALLTVTAPTPADAINLTVDSSSVLTQASGTVLYSSEYIGITSTGTYNHTGGFNTLTYDLYLG